MAREETEKLLQRAERAWQQKDQWDSQLRDIYKYALPQRDLYDDPQPGELKGFEVFDSTAVNSTARFANKFVNAVFPAYQKWAKLEAGPALEDSGNKDEINQALEKATDQLFSVIHNASNFQAVIGETALDIVAGTGTMIVQPGTPQVPVIYQAVPQIQVALENGPRGSVGAWHRRMKMESNLVKPHWEDAKIPEEVAKAITEDPKKKWTINEATYTDFDGLWYYDVVIKELRERIVERDLRKPPFVTMRYLKAANETQGRGPLSYALADIKTANKLVELVLKNATLAVSGPYTAVNDGTLNPDTLTLSPMTVIPVARNPGHSLGPSIAPLPRSGEFDVAYIELERLQNAIKLALLDEDLPPLTGQPRTATEIIQRIRRLVTQTGATFGRIVAELIIPIVQQTLDILVARRIIQLPPQLSQIDGFGVKLVVTSPLAQQQNLEDVEAIINAIEVSTALLGPEMTAQALKVEEVPAVIAEKMGVPQSIIRTEDERELFQAQMGAIAAQQLGGGEQPSPSPPPANGAGGGGVVAPSPSSPALPFQAGA